MEWYNRIGNPKIYEKRKTTYIRKISKLGL